jgi:hypothetical protein
MTSSSVDEIIKLFEFWRVELVKRDPKRVDPVFEKESTFELVKDLEISNKWITLSSWESNYHHWKFQYGKADTERRKQMLRVRHKFLSGLKDLETDKGVELTLEEVAAYMGVEMPQ